MMILGIDPALRQTGYGLIQHCPPSLRYLNCGSIRVSSNLTLAKRLLTIHQECVELIQQYQPDVMAIEETFVNNNAKSSLMLGHARGVLMLAAALHNIPVFEYPARLIKKSVAGVGKADKAQMQQMVKYLLPNAVIEDYDAADALAVAICHSSHATHHQWMNTEGASQ